MLIDLNRASTLLALKLHLLLPPEKISDLLVMNIKNLENQICFPLYVLATFRYQ